MAIREFTEPELEALLRPALAYSAAERAFRAVEAHAWHPAHSGRVEFGGGSLSTSLAYDDGGWAVRLERHGEGGFALICRPAGRPVALMPWEPIARQRASAVCALATARLANERAPCLAIVGTGTQARLHARALTRVRDVTRVLVVGRGRRQSAEFAAALARELGGGMRFEAADAGRAAAAADIVCLCTDSHEPVLLGNELRRGCHLNAAGATSFDAREVDTNAVLRAKVVIEDKEIGPRTGDLRIPIEEGRARREDFDVDLGDVVTGKRAVRTSEDDITLFETAGHPAVDFYLALAALEAAA